MPRFTLDQISKMPAHIQAQVVAQTGPKANVFSEPTETSKLTNELPPEPKEHPSARIQEETVYPQRSPIGTSPIYISAELLRHILDSFSAPFYVAKDETQRRAVVKHALQVLARQEANPHSIP